MGPKSEHRLVISLLGRVSVRLDGIPIEGSFQNKVLALLAYLAMERGPHSRESLATLFWPDLAPEAARSNVRVALYRLRQSLENLHVLHASRDSVFLSPDHWWLDVNAFLAPMGKDMSSDEMEARLNLYRGVFMAGASFEAIPDFFEWLNVIRETCHRQVLGLRDKLIACHERKDDLKAALHHAVRYLELEPWNEYGHRKMMELLARDGQEGAALAQYQLCKKLLAKELGTHPSAPTVELFEQIQKGKLRLGAARPYPFSFVEEAPPGLSEKPLNILVVDDHFLFRAGLTLMLNELESEVTVFEASSCEEALTLAQPEGGYDLILLDVNLAGMTGIDGLPCFKDCCPDTPVILCSGEEDMAVVRTGYELGAKGYMSKAMNAGDMMAVIHTVLDGGTAFPFDISG